MASRSPDTIRNIVFCGHGTSGKTTLIEHLLHAAGAISRCGAIEDGNTVCDFDEQEKERKHGLDLACCHFVKDGVQVNLLDTPGYRDFIGQFFCAVSAADCAVVVVGADDGVQSTTRKLWEILDGLNLPRMVVINRLDREHADHERVLGQIREQLGSRCVPLVLPDGSGGSLTRVDALLGGGSGGDAASALLEAIVETDEEMMEQYLGGEEIPADRLVDQFRKAVVACSIYPVLATSAAKSLGIAELLDALLKYTPPASEPLGRECFPLETPDQTQPITTGVDDPLLARVIKVVSDPYVGKLTYLRVFSGSIATGGTFFNSAKGKPEKVGKLVRLQGKEQEPVESAGAGDIAALVKVEGLKAFDVVTAGEKLGMRAPRVPTPMCSYAVTPKTKADEKKFAESIQKLLEEDVTLRAERDRRTHELVVAGMSQLHLQIVWNRLKGRYGVEVETKEPKVPYLETITGKGDDQYRHKKQTGGAGEFAEVWLRVEPVERGAGVEFENAVFGGHISNSYVQSAEKGIRAVMDHGILAGCQIVDVKVTVYDGKEHPVDSKDIAFQKAGREAFKKAFQQAKPVLLEPIVSLEVTFPSEHMGDIQADLTRRRGRVQGMDSLGSFQVLKALVPLAEIADYASSLGSITAGQGSYAIEPAHYEVVPPNIQQKVVEAYQKSLKED
ncbi:MAG: elongation factor G [Planctomycetes bacterium]|nr:elongation factor G [Planctomycetota bacterium]